MELEWKLHKYTFKPGAYNTSEVRDIMGVKRGTWVKAVAVRIGEAFNGTTPTISIGDGDDDEGFAAITDITIATPELYPGYGVFFSASNGKLYTGDDTIELDYIYNTGTTTGLATVYILYAETE